MQPAISTSGNPEPRNERPAPPGWLDPLLTSLRLKVIATLLSLALIPLVLMSFLNYRNMSRSLQDAARHSLQAAATETVLNLDAFTSAKLTSIGTEAKLPVLRAYLTTGEPEAAKNALHSLRSLNRQDPIFIFSSALLDAKGRNVIDTSGSYIGRDESRSDFFIDAIETGMATISPVRFDPGTGKPFLVLSAPVLSSDGKIVGVLRTFYNAHVLQQMVVGSNGLAGPQSFAVLLDENNLLLGYGGEAQRKALQLLFKLGTPLPQDQLDQLMKEGRLPSNPAVLDNPAVKEAISQSDLPQGQFASISSQLEHLPWRVVFVIPTSSFLVPLRNQAFEALMLLAGISSIIVLFAFWNARILFDPLRHLTLMATKVAGGDLDAKVPVESRDEIGQLAGTFNAMTRQLKERDQERDLLLAREKAARAEAEQANKLKDEFLATLSHELRTPLTAILGWVNLLKDNPTPQEMSEGLQVVERNAWAETQLVDDLLDVSRITRGKITLNRDALDFGMVIGEAVETVLPSAQAKSIDLQMRLPEKSLCIVGDWNRLRQVVLNLLNNAIKFTPEHGRVGVDLQQTEDQVTLAVSDTGIGIRLEHLSNIFCRFTQVDSSSTRRFGGMGLGLAITKHLVELHGGRVHAESEGEGKGATFVVSLPFMKIASEAAV